MSKDLSERESKSQSSQEEKLTNTEEIKTNAINITRPSENSRKTKYYCAINEKELNKVELAFFKKPTNSVILSDK